MTEGIPEDIFAVARSLADDAACFGYTNAALNIAKAIMSERLAAEARGREKQKEADARIAEAKFVNRQDAAGRMAFAAGVEIASLIRK